MTTKYRLETTPKIDIPARVLQFITETINDTPVRTIFKQVDGFDVFIASTPLHGKYKIMIGNRIVGAHYIDVISC